LASRRLEGIHMGADGREMRRHIRDLLHGETREDRLRIPIDELLARRAPVGLLEEEPLRLLARHARERPAAAELVAEELDLDLAAPELLERILRLRRAIPAAVPHDHRTRPVVAGGDHALEIGVLHGMVLDVHGQPSLLGMHRRPLGHRPALQHAVHLEAEVIVEAAGRVLLHDEEASADEPAPSEGLGRPLRIPLFSVLLQLRRPLLPHYPSPLSSTSTTIRVRGRRESWSIAGCVLPCQVSRISPVWEDIGHAPALTWIGNYLLRSPPRSRQDFHTCLPIPPHLQPSPPQLHPTP